MEAMPKEARGLIILATAVVFRAARMIAKTPTDSEEALDSAERLVKVAEERGHISFKGQ